MYLSREEERLKMLKIIYELDYNTSKIKEIINEYELKILDNRVRSLVKNIEFQIDKNKDSINELKNPFLLFIVGSGNYGKSTLINTLLNEEIVKTTDLPNTWKIDLFIKSEREKMEITYYDKSVVVKNLKEGNKLLEKEEIKFKESRRKVSKIVNEYKKLNKVDVNILKKYKSNQEEQYLYKSNIAQIKYNIRKGKILEKFIVVDTPGLNQNLLKDTLNRIKEYYIKADGVIWLIDAQNLVSKENNELIKEIKKIDDLNNHNKNK
ncbi:MAG: GTPase, partial [Romboutsia sp.]